MHILKIKTLIYLKVWFDSSLTSKDLYAVGVLQMIMGTGSYMKYSENTTVNRLGKGVGEAIKGNPFAVSDISK